MNRIPILTYHGMHAPGDDYASNDHVALETDMQVLLAMGFRVVPLADVVTYVTSEGGASYLDEGRWAALTFDDGPDWDYHDYDYDGRRIKGFYRILREAASGATDPRPTAVSFVIASPEARKTLDVVCGAGLDRWRDTWWQDAAGSGVLAIGNHSWDHVHVALPTVAQREQRKGSFHAIDSFQDADIQVFRAEQYIAEKTAGTATQLFAHPYGEAPDYLVTEYFPRFRQRHGIRAAFVTGGDYATRGVNRWKIPRFVYREHWTSPEGLTKILADAARRNV